MDAERFNLLVNIVKILQKQSETKSMQSVMDIIENYNEDFTSEQKARVLSELMNFMKGNDMREKRFEAESERMREFTSGFDYS